MTPETVWKIVGFGGQGLFFGRFFVQWIASERSKRSVVPTAFWFFSLGGGTILLAQLDRGFDVVSGVRVDRRDSWLRRVSSRVANAVRNWATDESITDVGCSLKAYRRELLSGLPMFTGMHRFLPTLVRWNGARVTEIPVRHRPRRHGVAKYGIGNRLFRAAADLLAVRWMRTRWIDPRNHEELPR